jgi:hypothetical protein
VDRPPERGQSRLANRFGERGVRVDGLFHLFHRGLEVAPEDELGDQFGRVRADDMGAQDLGVFPVADDLEEALCVAMGEGPAVADPGELAHLNVESLLAGLGLGQADRGDLRMAVRAVGHVVVVYGPVGLPGDFSTQAIPSWEALWASNCRPAQSPTA